MKIIISILTIFAALTMTNGQRAHADALTECTLLDFCYCVDSELNGIIDAQVKKIRAAIKGQRDEGKAIGYLSIPISTAEGS